VHPVVEGGFGRPIGLIRRNERGALSAPNEKATFKKKSLLRALKRGSLGGHDSHLKEKEPKRECDGYYDSKEKKKFKEGRMPGRKTLTKVYSKKRNIELWATSRMQQEEGRR